MNNSSALGEISVLTPSQRREQERLRKEKEEKEAAKKKKREEAKLEQERQERAKKSSRIIIMIISIVCALGWAIFAILREYGEFVTVVVALLIALPAISIGAKFAEGKD